MAGDQIRRTWQEWQPEEYMEWMESVHEAVPAPKITVSLAVKGGALRLSDVSVIARVVEDAGGTMAVSVTATLPEEALHLWLAGRQAEMFTAGDFDTDFRRLVDGDAPAPEA